MQNPDHFSVQNNIVESHIRLQYTRCPPSGAAIGACVTSSHRRTWRRGSMASCSETSKVEEWVKVLNDASGCARQDCGREEPALGPARVYRHELPTLGRVVQTEQVYVCPQCTREVRWEMQYRLVDADINRGNRVPSAGSSKGRNKKIHAQVIGESDQKRYTDLQYSAVWNEDTGHVLPIHEGTIQDGTYIDLEGNAELMAEFAKQYLSGYRSNMPTGGLPTSVVEVMPALHLLLIAAELALKADLIRSNLKPGKRHTLKYLYSRLEGSHREAIDELFAECDPVVRLNAAEMAPPSVVDTMAVYDRSYGGRSNVYLDSRYYAEPGLSMFKSQTPLPSLLAARGRLHAGSLLVF